MERSIYHVDLDMKTQSIPLHLRFRTKLSTTFIIIFSFLVMLQNLGNAECFLNYLFRCMKIACHRLHLKKKAIQNLRQSHPISQTKDLRNKVNLLVIATSIVDILMQLSCPDYFVLEIVPQ